MKSVALFVKCHAKTGRGAEVLALLQDSARAAAEEVGTLVFAIHVASQDPDTFWVYELYASSESQLAHSDSDTTARLRESIRDLLAEPLQVNKTESLGAIGLPEKWQPA